MTNLIILSQKDAEQYNFKPNQSYVCISITDPEGGFAHLQDKNFYQILRLQFHDIEKNMLQSLGNFYFGMTPKDAKQIKYFLSTWWNNVDNIIVHCYAGQRCSPGIAAAIDEYYNGEGIKYFRNEKYEPNQRCYQLLLDELCRTSS